MRRISKLRSRREVELERERESLRDIRWARRRNVLMTFAVLGSLTILALTDGPSHLARWLTLLF